MSRQKSLAMTATVSVFVVSVLLASPGLADTVKYPDWEGAWVRRSAGVFDATKPAGLAQKPPLTEEYQKVFEKSVADQAAGGQGNNPMSACIPPGMPRMMIAYGVGLEFVITPKVTYMMLGEPMMQVRRIFTDGRAFTDDLEPAFTGYSIGAWEASKPGGDLDTLVVETRAIKGPRSYDSSGMPFHMDNETRVKERIFLDPKNPDILRDQITTFDHALTQPWSTEREYHRKRNPVWQETTCGEDEHQVKIGKEHYYLSADGNIMPTRPNQPPPDLKYFSKK